MEPCDRSGCIGIRAVGSRRCAAHGSVMLGPIRWFKSMLASTQARDLEPIPFPPTPWDDEPEWWQRVTHP